jgi:hypothetical protein
MMKRTCIIMIGVLLFGIGTTAYAQEFKPEYIRSNAIFQVETRVDALTQFDDGYFDTHGICKNFNLVLKGKLSDRISYKFRHRLNRAAQGDDKFLNATDAAWIAFNATDKFIITAGKQTVALGGFEYDYAPIDMYIPSILYDNIPGYKVGVDLGVVFGKNDWHFQITNGGLGYYVDGNGNVIHTERVGDHTFLTYTFALNGQYVDGINYRHSVNFYEYEKGRFVNLIALGHQFNIGKFCLEADLTNRAYTDDMQLFKDYTLTGNFKYDFGKVTGFVKLGYDKNENYIPTPNVIDARVEQLIYGIGFEYFPFETKDIRFHAFYANSRYDMLNKAKTGTNLINFGVRWNVRLL